MDVHVRGRTARSERVKLAWESSKSPDKALKVAVEE